FGARLREISFAHSRVRALRFGENEVVLGDSDSVVLAAPPWIAQELVPGLVAPDDYRAILNAHFKIAPPSGQPLLLGMIGALTEWLFAFDDRLSGTISGADRLIDEPREELAAKIWVEVATATGLPAAPLPRWQIVKEKRATFAATPAQEKRRPGAATSWPDLFLAGDWTNTGLPATIEGAIRSGFRAAELAARRV
ncbi:MAG: FAD-dependent oxidoreductase, partial [Methylocystis sp.]|nr:FAD-dependent oxidoreductase [Methylocystis sp.]